MKSQTIRKHVLALGASAVAITTSMLIGAVQPAFAQADPQAEEQPEEQAIVITGSRIVRRDYSANSPLVTVSNESFEDRGSPAVEEALNDLPQFATGGSASISSGAGAAFSGAQAAPGAATLNLRGLGLNRTLVLVNGRRAQPVNAQLVVDVNTIPSAAIKNVEVITGGAAAVYGADAIAGVVNFKMRDDFEGLELNTQAGIAEVGDGRNFQVSALIGGNFADGRGNAMFGVVWSDRARAYYKNRTFYTNGWKDPNTAGGGGGLPINVAIVNGINWGVNFDGSLFRTDRASDPAAPFKGALNNLEGGAGFKLNPASPGTTNRALGYNDPAFLVNVPLNRYALYGSAHYDLTDAITLYFEGNYSHSKAYGQSFSGQTNSIWNISVPYNHLNDDPDSATFGTTTGFGKNNFHPVSRQLADLLNARTNPDANWTLSRGLNFLGDLYIETVSDIFQATAGLRGDVGVSDWTWDVYASHGNTNVVVRQPEGAISHPNLTQLIQGTTKDVAQNPSGRSNTINGAWSAGWSNNATFNPNTCTSGIPLFNADGSVPSPQPGTGEGVVVSKDCKDFATLELNNVTQLDQTVLEATLQGKLIDLWAGETRFAVGATYRQAGFSYAPDTGNSGEQTNTSVVNQISLPKPTKGDVRVREVYGELLVPVLHDLPLIKKLDLELGGRYSDYDRSGGVATFKILGDWQVTDWFRLRGGFQLANRAPNIYEQFAPIAGAIGGSLDPCVNIKNFTPTWGNRSNPDELVSALGGTATANTNPNIINLQAACKALIVRDGGYPYVTLGENPAAVGQDPSLYPNGLDQTRLANLRTFLGYNQAFPFSIALEQGNPNLKSEKARTVTIGAVINSPFDTPLLRRFNLTVDYYSVNIKDTIGTPNGSEIYQQCLNPVYNTRISAPVGTYTGAQLLEGNPYCALVNRFPFGTPAGDLGGLQGGTDRTYDAKYLNKGSLKTAGLDVTTNWSVGFEDIGIQLPGSLAFNATANILLKYTESAFPGATPVNYKGTVQNQAYKYKIQSGLTYMGAKGSIGYRVQYLPAIRPTASAAAAGTFGTHSHYQVDLFGRYQLNDLLEVRAGVDNLFNAAPEIVGATASNAARTSTSAVYDSIGRAYYLGIKLRM